MNYYDMHEARKAREARGELPDFSWDLQRRAQSRAEGEPGPGFWTHEATRQGILIDRALARAFRQCAQVARIHEGLSIGIERLTLRHFLWAAKPRGDMLAYLTAITQEAPQ